MRVAIVGLGPKGLFALERLLDRAGETPLTIDAFEPHPVPGAGPVYDPAQPSYLRMNFPDDQINMWPPGHTLVPAGARRPFADGRGYSARADVGRYLAQGLQELLRHAPPTARVRIHPRRVTSVTAAGDGWRIEDTVYDEVLLAIGHEGGLPETGTIAPGAAVAVRGFALTFIDTALALTEGRGGRFAATGHPWRLRYVPSGDDVGVLLPFSRSRRPMLAKPAFVPPTGLATAGRERILALDDPAGLLDILAAAVVRALEVAGGVVPDVRDVARELERVQAGGRWPVAAAELERSLDVATGLAVPDVPWALGQAWRSLYPAIITRFSHGGMPAEGWPAFRRLALEMERIAFGPPARNAARLVALVAAGKVDTRRRSQAVDAVIDAVLPPPGAHRTNPLVGGLLDAGHVRVARGQRGLDVDLDLSCQAADGSITRGLAAIGRLTEDAVIGNDTLSRTLHPEADRWAARLTAPVPVA